LNLFDFNSSLKHDNYSISIGMDKKSEVDKLQLDNNKNEVKNSAKSEGCIHYKRSCQFVVSLKLFIQTKRILIAITTLDKENMGK
jgi:hypothetical protein